MWQVLRICGKSGGELADLMDKWLVWWTCSGSLGSGQDLVDVLRVS